MVKPLNGLYQWKAKLQTDIGEVHFKLSGNNPLYLRKRQRRKS